VDLGPFREWSVRFVGGGWNGIGAVTGKVVDETAAVSSIFIDLLK
jgi:hypothetical protein